MFGLTLDINKEKYTKLSVLFLLFLRLRTSSFFLFCSISSLLCRKPVVRVFSTNYASFFLLYLLGSNCKVAPFIKGAAPTCNCKLEHPFIKGAAPTVKVHLAPFINGATCSIYKESSSNFKFQSKY